MSSVNLSGAREGEVPSQEADALRRALLGSLRSVEGGAALDPLAPGLRAALHDVCAAARKNNVSPAGMLVVLRRLWSEAAEQSAEPPEAREATLRLLIGRCLRAYYEGDHRPV